MRELRNHAFTVAQNQSPKSIIKTHRVDTISDDQSTPLTAHKQTRLSPEQNALPSQGYGSGISKELSPLKKENLVNLPVRIGTK